MFFQIFHRLIEFLTGEKNLCLKLWPSSFIFPDFFKNDSSFALMLEMGIKIATKRINKSKIFLLIFRNVFYSKSGASEASKSFFESFSSDETPASGA
jgi:hypothetical protein